MKKRKTLRAMFSQKVDADTFMFALNVYQAAAGMTMPVENPQLMEFDVAGTVYSMADIPVNRGMMAASKELASQGVPQEERMAYLLRLMHFGELLEQRDRLGDFIKPSDEDGALMVADALMKACAVAKINIGGTRIGFDIDDVLRHANSFANKE